MATEQDTQVCAECGATIYPEHLQRQVAERREGRLLCPHCLRDKQAAASAPVVEQSEISLIEEEAPPGRHESPPQIRYSDGTAAADRGAERDYRRTLHHQEVFATRCKTFHCKLSGPALEHLDEQINDWVDAHQDVEIKFATSTVGLLEGKSSSDQHLIVTLFY
jgi:hypothetical protein